MARLEDIEERANFYREYLKNDLTQLIKIPSWLDTSTATEEMPFGRGIWETFELVKQFCTRENLTLHSVGGYAFHADFGIKPQIAFASHLDTVSIYEEKKWYSPPLQLTEKNNTWYGLGVNDDKMAALLGIYVVKICKDLGLSPKIRLIFGGAEESSWTCMKHYLQDQDEPKFVIVADGNFPLVVVEKGVVQFELSCEVTGIDKLKTSFDHGFSCEKVEVTMNGKENLFIAKKTPSRHPYRTVNAISRWAKNMPQQGIWKLLSTMGDGLGEQLGIVYPNKDILKNRSNTIALIGATINDNLLTIRGDFRYMRQEDREAILHKIQEYDISIKIIREMPLINESINNPEIQILQHVYQKVSGDEVSEALTMGAMSYARAFKRAIAYGPCFPRYKPNSHNANESMPIQDILKALVIYTEAIIQLDEYYN